MVSGEFQHNVDKKGRMFIPSKFREELGEKLMVCKGLDGKPCLFVFSMEAWEALDNKIQSMPMATSIKLQRFIYSGAAEVECDGQGRILLPAALRGYAGLDAAATVVGMSRRAEIWSPENWEEESKLCTAECAFNLMEELGI